MKINKLKEVLIKEKITQVQLSKFLSVSQKTISIRLKNNDWSIIDAEKIRIFLKKETVDEIFFRR
ncbi:hypothetical protein HLPR_11180 [Helicovermis profundi]|uniref:HTH cro/C1-type domain-containing protein n=1 Tax=Helicovermis profundi TaxID=3065157 RepID=A0AAU9EDR3_9FIRM|nr:hypothetical protein HLPR_11180 [Clostridia bacterium S502]